jgi:deazaflavin-dependent oxidoreductase (nitroreductase family)
MWRLMRRMNPNLKRLLDQGKGPVGLVLLLTTTGRKSGLPRTTPLQYERVGQDFIVGSGRGQTSDWIANIRACQQVDVQVGQQHYPGSAEIVTDAAQIADFFELRLKRRPVLFRLMLWMDGVPLRVHRPDLERFAQKKAIVVIHPQEDQARLQTLH